MFSTDPINRLNALLESTGKRSFTEKQELDVILDIITGDDIYRVTNAIKGGWVAPEQVVEAFNGFLAATGDYDLLNAEFRAMYQ